MNPRFIPLLVYGGLSLAVLLPLLLPGFVLTLDMVFVPHPPLVDMSRSSFPFHALLHWLSYIIPADILQKVMLLGILFLSGWGMHRLVQTFAPKIDQLWQWGCYFAGALYMVNPFVYGRFMAGQFAVLLGYALLPFFVRALFRFLAGPVPKRAALAGVWAVLVGIVSVHTLGLLAVVAVFALGLATWRHRREAKVLRALGTGVLLAVGLWIAANLYWLIPLAMGQGNTSAALAQFNTTDRLAFATLGDSFFGRAVHVLGLQGFWAEGTNMFVLPQDRMPLWGLLSVLVLGLAVFGGVALWRLRQRFAALVLGASAVVAAVVATGALGDLLANAIPFFAGYREPQKFVALLALAYAVFGAAGLVAVLRRIRQPGVKQAVVVAALVLPVAFTPTMLWGFGGQLAPRQYPSDWYVMRDQLKQHAQATTLFLPWHKYMTFGFSERIIENPAVSFFEAPIVVASDPEFRGVQAVASDSRTQKMHELIATHPSADVFATSSAALGIQYVLLAKEYDFVDYEPLVDSPDFTVAADTENLTLYRNQKWKEGTPWSQ